MRVGLTGKRIPWRAPVLALSLALALPFGAAGCLGCPTALLSGDLVAHGEELAVGSRDGDVQAVKWPFGYGVRADGDRLVLTNILGAVEAREGDHVDLGGGMIDDRFGVCGEIKVRPAT